MRTAQEWLDAYGESHRNPTNKALHWVCIPLIMWSLVALVAHIPSPLAGAGVDSAALLLGLVSLYYLRLSRPLALGMALISAALWGLTRAAPAWLPADTPLWEAALWVFVLAWVGQFVGHKVEGKKPSFFEDLQFLLIGPMWLLSALYRRLGVGI
ncbi:MAG: DUF962 domain-containing protein [Deltaproteobacteria bacterium]|nr:DUF962 domain-containing protein [Deltaproteobacteria bacterium]